MTKGNRIAGHCGECSDAVAALVEDPPDPPANATQADWAEWHRLADPIAALIDARHLIHKRAPAFLEPQPRVVGSTHPEHVLSEDGCPCYHAGWERGYSNGFDACEQETRDEIARAHGEPASDEPDPSLPVN